MFHVLQYRVYRDSELANIARELDFDSLDIVVSYVSDEVCPTVSLKQFIHKFLSLMVMTKAPHEELVDIENFPVCFLTAALKTAFDYDAPVWMTGFSEFSFYTLPGITFNTEVWVVLQ